MVLDRAAGSITHRLFSDLPGFLAPGDVLIINDTKVLPARLYGVFEDGKSVEALLVQPAGDQCWEAMVKPARHARIGRRLRLACGHLEATVVTLGLHGRRILRLPEQTDLRSILEAYGVMPLPPYIKRRAETREPRAETKKEEAENREPRMETGNAELGSRGSALVADRERYQTVYAAKEGAIAAPTAGLHFTPELLDGLRSLGVRVCPLTLHVGPGTFLPIRVEDVSQHRMETERYTIPDETVAAVAEARGSGRRVLAVGTTSVRSLEHAARERGALRPGAGAADLFITPGFQFRAVTTFLTNFHLPRSTPLILVAAFAGLELTRRAYAEAIALRYRFYSYGDAMLIL
jgi:S-adenosylmethionine:tRNA ribosyltransferase-isomerase